MDDSYANGAPQQQDQSQGGYCIEIYVSADGKPTSVNVETMDQEDGDDGSMQSMQSPDQSQDDSDRGVPVASLDEAMSVVQQIIQNQGAMPDGAPQQDPEQEMRELQSGYGKGSYVAQQQGMSIGRVFKGNM